LVAKASKSKAKAPETAAEDRAAESSAVESADDSADDSALAALSYEAAFAQFEEILQKLENDDLPLDESLTLYEDGVALVSHCTQLLDSATLRVQQWQDGDSITDFDSWQEG